ncbi:MAG: GGDEF domain-containing protein [Sandaracinaceae bacterium]
MPVLVVLSGPQIGERVVLPARLEVGRDPRCGLRLLDPEAAPLHLVIERTERPERWRIQDLGAGRTRVGGAALPVRTALVVGTSDVIEVGATTFRVELHDAVEQEFDRVVAERLHRDDLTGLLSRRKFEQELASALAAGEEAGPVCLVMLDVDGLKRVNDTHGHLAGAAVIAHVGRVVAAAIEGRALAARLGGDELVVLVPAHRGEAIALAWTLVTAIATSPCPYEGRSLVVTASAGVGWRALEPEELLRAADAALLDAKRRGGNQVITED